MTALGYNQTLALQLPMSPTSYMCGHSPNDLRERDRSPRGGLSLRQSDQRFDQIAFFVSYANPAPRRRRAPYPSGWSSTVFWTTCKRDQRRRNNQSLGLGARVLQAFSGNLVLQEVADAGGATKQIIARQNSDKINKASGSTEAGRGVSIGVAGRIETTSPLKIIGEDFRAPLSRCARRSPFERYLPPVLARVREL